MELRVLKDIYLLAKADLLDMRVILGDKGRLIEYLRVASGFDLSLWWFEEVEYWEVRFQKWFEYLDLG